MSVNKKIYVNGGVVIYTPFFCYENAGAGYKEPPTGAEIMECDDEVDGCPCIKITAEKAPSIFNEYYAKTFFSTLYQCCDFMHKSFQQDYDDYLKRIYDIENFLTILDKLPEEQVEKFLRLLYGNVITAFDSFMSDIVLTKITHDKDSFEKYVQNTPIKKQLKEQLQRKWSENTCDNVEQTIIDWALMTSYCNVKRINEICNAIFDNVVIEDKNGKMQEYFINRHIIFHRDGKRKDGKYIVNSAKDVTELITEVNAFVKQIMDKII